MIVWKPSVTVAAVIEREGRFLFVQERSEGRLVLNQPAGHLDPGESLLEACRREVLEETAHRFDPAGLVGVYRWHYAPKDVTFLRFCFHGTVGQKDDSPLDREIVALHWLSVDELQRRAMLGFAALEQKCVDDFVAGNSFPLEVFSAEYS